MAMDINSDRGGWNIAVDVFSGGYVADHGLVPGQVSPDIEAQQSTLLFYSPDGDSQQVQKGPSYESDTNTTISYCKLTQAYVESNVTCDSTAISQGCRVTAQRQSLLPHAPVEFTSLNVNPFSRTLSHGGLTRHRL